jgi:hypothetical protein
MLAISICHSRDWIRQPNGRDQNQIIPLFDSSLSGYYRLGPGSALRENYSALNPLTGLAEADRKARKHSTIMAMKIRMAPPPAKTHQLREVL